MNLHTFHQRTRSRPATTAAALGLILLLALAIGLFAGLPARLGADSSSGAAAAAGELSRAELAQPSPATTNDYSGKVQFDYVGTGVYSDTLIAPPTSPPTDTVQAAYLGEIDLSLHLIREGDVVTGHVLLDGSFAFTETQRIALYEGFDPVAVGPSVSGTFDGTTMRLESEPFTTEASNEQVTRRFQLVSDPVEEGMVRLTGEYRETIWGFGVWPNTAVGRFRLQRPVFDATPVATSGNSAPFGVDDLIETLKGQSITINVISNDVDGDFDLITVTGVDAPQHGTATTDGTRITYVPNADFVGFDSFAYTISDGRDGTGTASVRVTVNEPGQSTPGSTPVSGETPAPGETPMPATPAPGETPTLGTTPTPTSPASGGPADGTLYLPIITQP